ncbi:Pectin lyase-like superfamily protein [Citrus sinensis]|nr:Pectin lyase-like superfamily protein [Citrus sinensis]
MERGLWRYIKQSNPSGSSGENILAATYKFPRLRGISLHLKDRQVGKERIEGLGFTSQMSMDLLLMEMEKLMAKDHSGGSFAQIQKNHISLDNCQDATLSNLHISAPESSPNTDGIDISASQNIHILNSNIATGDDCIAINTGSSQINVTGLTCGPGHGISIGSLGKQGEAAAVEEVHVKNCTLNATQNGLRIKTWQGGSGYARKITFNDITLTDVDNPIIIDQFYCPHEQCSNETNAVKISDVSYTGIHGTSITQDAIALNCSRTVGCDNIVLEHIHIASSNSKEGTYSTCINAHGKCDDSVPSVGCLK